MVPAANVGNGAVGTESIASIRDLHVSRNGARTADGDCTFRHGSEHGCLHALQARLIDAKRLRDDLNDIVFLAAWDECGGFGKLGFQILSVTGGHAAGDDQRSASGHIGHTGNLEDGLKAFLGSALDKRAGVHHHGIGCLGVLLDHEAATGELRLHALGIYLVFRAAHGDERDARALDFKHVFGFHGNP